MGSDAALFFYFYMLEKNPQLNTTNNTELERLLRDLSYVVHLVELKNYPSVTLEQLNSCLGPENPLQHPLHGAIIMFRLDDGYLLPLKW